MDAEKLIQVSFQIPPSALDSLSRLTEQLRMLTETVSAVPAPRTADSEQGKNDFFNPERFYAMQRGGELPPQAARAEPADIQDAAAVSAESSQTESAETASAAVSRIEDAEAVSAEVQAGLPDAETAGDTLHRHSESTAAADAASDRQHTLPEERDRPLPPAEAADSSGEIPSVRAAMEETIPDAPDASRYAELPISGAESVRITAEERELAAAAVQFESSDGIELPLGTGVVVQTQPEMPQSRWGDVTEELVVPGPAPLTAEAVSLAFERDSRRYDNGFPLY